jgi:hypothetical protein
VFAYGAGQNETGRVMEIPTAKYPGDIARLRKQYFSSDDQLVTLYLAALGGTPEATFAQFKACARRGRAHQPSTSVSASSAAARCWRSSTP